MTEREAENRQRIGNGVAIALRSTSLPPEEKTLIEMVARGQRSSVVVEIEVVEALFKHRMLLTAVLTSGNLNAPGWRHVEKRVDTPPRPWMKPTTESELRVMGYHLTEPGLTYMYDLGGWLNLDAVTDYTRWELRWNPRRPWFDTKLQPLKASPPPPARATASSELSSSIELQAVTAQPSADRNPHSLVAEFTEIPTNLVKVASRINDLQGVSFEDRKALLAYSAWEKNPSSHSMAQMAAALGISTEELNALIDRVIEDERFEKYLRNL